MRLTTVTATLFGAVLFLGGTATAGPTEDLLARVPADANAVAVIRSERLYQTPLAKREGWLQQRQQAHQAGTMALPANVQLGVLAAHLAPGGEGRAWEVGVVKMLAPLALKTMATREGASIEAVAGQDVFLSKRNCYFTAFDTQTVGMYFPANRQELSRWLRAVKNVSRPAVSDYLQAAARRNEPVVFAYDLEDLINAAGVRNYLTASRALKGQDVNRTELAQVLAGLRGMTIAITVTDVIEAEMRVDFNTSPAPVAKVLKALIVETLQRAGATFDEIEDMTGEVDGNSYVLKGPLTTPALRRVLMLILPPTPAVVAPDQAGGPEAIIPATQNYLTEISTYVDDLSNMVKRINNTKQYSMWHDTYAKKIESLPTVNVDPEVIAYGTNAANLMRAVSMSERGTNIERWRLEQHKQQQVYASGGYGGWGYWNQNNFAEIDGQKADASAKGAKERMDLWQTLREECAAVRKRMTEKYKVQF